MIKMKKLPLPISNFIVLEFNYFIYNKKNFTSILFLIFIICLFPFCIGPDLKILSKLALSILWIIIILTLILSLNKFLNKEYNDGILEQYYFTPLHIESIIFIKLIFHWISTIIPLLLILPIFIYFFNLEDFTFSYFIFIFLFIIPLLINFGAIISTLMLTLDQQTDIICLLLLPIYLPLIIFSVNSLDIINNKSSDLLFEIKADLIYTDIFIPIIFILGLDLFLIALIPYIIKKLLEITMH